MGLFQTDTILGLRELTGGRSLAQRHYVVSSDILSNREDNALAGTRTLLQASSLSSSSRVSKDQFSPSDVSIFSPPSSILNKWSIVDRLHTVRVPTFVVNGRADIAQDFVVAPFFEKIPKAKWVTLERSSHMPFWEERPRFMQLVREFLAL
ncbi:hypothetical protein OF83DRAFT_1173305 [Amylostereum chailletii]|nr:hypothetical protein OF83DRAFT_1173305 [Amylostereum chailletii]